jgi:hypothetical protein
MTARVIVEQIFSNNNKSLDIFNTLILTEDRFIAIMIMQRCNKAQGARGCGEK